MNLEDIQLFYEEHTDEIDHTDFSYTGHFDILHWENLKHNLSACERLQRKPFFKIALLKGNATYHCSSREINISGYSIVFTDPLTRSTFKTDDENFEGKYCICTENFLRGNAKVNLHQWPVFHQRDIFVKELTSSDYEQIKTYFYSIEEEKDSAYIFKEELIRSRIFDIIHYVQKKLPTSIVIRQQNDDTLHEQFLKQLEIAFFEVSPKKPLKGKTPAYFAALLNCSVDKLNLAIKQASGKTTQQMIHERLIEEAGVFLKYSDLSMKEIAWTLRFQETSHFLNFYKKHTGVTPTEHRNS